MEFNPTLYADQNGGNPQKGDICITIADLLSCTAEPNIL